MVIDKLQLDITPRALVSKVDASTVKDTVLLDVSVEDTNAQQAANIANAYGAVFGDYIAKIENLEFNRSIPPLIQVVSMATAADAEESGLSPEVLLPVAALVGLAVAAGVIRVLEHYDSRFRSCAEVERFPGAQVIGSLPRRRSGMAGSPLGDLREEGARFVRAAVRLSISVEYALRRLSRVRAAPVVAIVGAGESVDQAGVVLAAVVQGSAVRGRTVRVMSETRYPEVEAGTLVADPRQPPPRYLRKLGSIQSRERRFESGGVVRFETLDTDVTELRMRCDLVVIDASDFEVSPSAQLVADAADAVVVVVGIGETTKESLAHLVAAIDVLGKPKIGTIVNGVNAKLKPGRG